jgi:hypothetical protein
MTKEGGRGNPEGGNSAASDGDSQQQAPFELQEHIGRQLKNLFDEVAEQPIPEKLRKLLEELERKGPKT